MGTPDTVARYGPGAPPLGYGFVYGIEKEKFVVLGLRQP
jgi:hypothetical protein